MLVTEPLPDENRGGVGSLRLPLSPVSTRVLEIELSQPLPIITAFDNTTQTHYKRVFCLFRLHTHPLGILQLQFQSDHLSPQDYAPLIWRAFECTLLSHLKQDGLPPIHEVNVEGLPFQDLPHCMAARERFLTHAPFVSVIVPTRDRPESLARCIDALLKLHYPDYEILVVDNCPTTQETADLVQKTYQRVSNLRYVREDNPGISHARNRGMHEARGEILAFTDDDVIVDTYWLAQCAQAFAQSTDIACVTGHTLPLELNTPAQLWFEDISWIENGDVNNKFSPRIFDKKTRHIQLYRGNLCGHGANMAAKADFLRIIGGFDVVLGTGTPTMGGEDLAFFLHVIMHNKKLAYEPTALVHHLHRRDYDKLRQQVFGYGTGFTAYLLHMLLRYPVLWLDLLTKTAYDILSTLLIHKTQKPSPAGEPKNLAKLKSVRKSTNYPRELVTLQVKGLLYGPVAYVKSRRQGK